MSRKDHAILVTQLYFSHVRGIAPDLVAAAVAKDGMLVASFDITLAPSREVASATGLLNYDSGG